MSLQIYADARSVNCHKVLAALEHMGSDFELVHVDYLAGEHKQPAYLKINPNGTLPSAIHDGIVITESNAIMQYAADAQGPHDAYPADIKKRAVVNSWLLWEASGWFRSNYVYLVENVLKGMQGLGPDPAVLAAEEVTWLKLANVLNDQLKHIKFVTGDTVTIADFALLAPMHVYQIQMLPLDKVPHVRRWVADMEKVPAWHHTQAVVSDAFGLSKYVRATLNYSTASGVPTEVYFYEDDRAAKACPPGDDAQEVAIHDGWTKRNEFSADIHGFSLHDYKSTFPKDKWGDEELVKSQFYTEVANFVKTTVGASKVLVFDHTIRSKSHEAKKLTDESQTSQRAPVRLVHCDYTAESGPIRVRQLLGDEEADKLLSKRVAFLNVWKPLSKVEEMPLAMCDVTSSPKTDFFKLFLRYRDRDGENYVMSYSPEHKWYYFPQMEENHCIILKTYDSEESVARFVGHSAFEDPTSRTDAPFRESVEIRTIAFF